jgi:hypothetical protein
MGGTGTVLSLLLTAIVEVFFDGLQQSKKLMPANLLLLLNRWQRAARLVDSAPFLSLPRETIPRRLPLQ